MLLDFLHEEEVVARTWPKAFFDGSRRGRKIDEAFGTGGQVRCAGRVGVDDAVAAAPNGRRVGRQCAHARFHLHELTAEAHNVGFLVVGEPGGREVADAEPDFVADHAVFGKLFLVAGQNGVAAEGFYKETPLRFEADALGGGGIENVQAGGLEDAFEESVTPREDFASGNVLIQKCSGPGGLGHQFEVHYCDAGEGTEAAREQFCEVETRDVLNDHATGLDNLTFEGGELHADDEVADCAKETAPVAARMGGKDAANRGFAGKGRLDGEELPMLRQRGCQVGIADAGLDADREVAWIVGQNAIERFCFNADVRIDDRPAHADFGACSRNFDVLAVVLTMPQQVRQLGGRRRVFYSHAESVILSGQAGRKFCIVETTMQFAFTEEQNELRKMVRDFATAELKPHVLAWDEAQEFPLNAVKQAASLGLLGIIFPEEYGGAGLGYIEYSIVVEELARVDPSFALIVAAHNSLCSNHLYVAGNEEQKRRYLPKLATGEWIGCWSLTEPEAGSDAGGTRTQAVRSDGVWVLNGAKTFTTNAHYADLCVAMAVTDRASSHHGISAFLIERSAPGYRLGKKENKLGMRSSATGEVIFENCRLAEAQLLGVEGEGFVDSLRILDGGRISIAALSVGIAQGAYEEALKYSKQRKQFGRFISEFQAIQHKLADMATQIEAARLLTLQAAWLKDEGKTVTKQSAMAKLFASEIAVEVCNEALQVHGGYGFIKDYPVEKFYRDVKLMTIGEGTSEIQRMVIARQLLKAQ